MILQLLQKNVSDFFINKTLPLDNSLPKIIIIIILPDANFKATRHGESDNTVLIHLSSIELMFFQVFIHMIYCQQLSFFVLFSFSALSTYWFALTLVAQILSYCILSLVKLNFKYFVI